LARLERARHIRGPEGHPLGTARCTARCTARLRRARSLVAKKTTNRGVAATDVVSERAELSTELRGLVRALVDLRLHGLQLARLRTMPGRLLWTYRGSFWRLLAKRPPEAPCLVASVLANFSDHVSEPLLVLGHHTLHVRQCCQELLVGR